MSDSESGSDGGVVLAPTDVDIEKIRPNEVVEDFTGDDDLLSDRSTSPLSLNIGDDMPRVKPRSYQIEMLEESLKGNIIIAADTGSGKTHIAVLRILHELEQVPLRQRIWFLAPTVSLCSQQFEYIQSLVSFVQIKCLKGDDGVDRWTTQNDWNVVLKNVRIVVSTFQVLLDALSHGFVKMESLALIVFDEAHNCVGNHPGAKIMKSFYHPRKSAILSVPHILGLTASQYLLSLLMLADGLKVMYLASPVMRSDPLSLEKIEQTLDAVARTPTKHRAELRLQVNLPVLQQVYYQSLASPNISTQYSRAIKSLAQVYAGLNIHEDPCVLHLNHQDTEKGKRALSLVMRNHRTKCQLQIKSFHDTSVKIANELGEYGADWYILQTVSKCLRIAEESDSLGGISDLSNAEKLYITKELRKIELDYVSISTPTTVVTSEKVEKLIDSIVQDPLAIQGIIFVETRAEVAVLYQILSVHPRTRSRFKIGTMVGTSAYKYRTKNLGELIDVKSQKNILSLFKTGIIKIVIATSVLEEGIDVPACNLVICFQKPANLKSFVQRRGRARHRESKLILLLDPKVDKINDWEQLEADMKRLYEDEMRALKEVLAVEDAEQSGCREFRVDSTGALLDLGNAMAHLYHFCATLPAKEYVDQRPDFVCSYSASNLVRCQLILPISVIDHLRRHESRTSWQSEKNAMKDAAFEAYVALYKAGLINDNLLPLLRHKDVDEQWRSEVEKRAAILIVENQINPWVEVAKASKAFGNTQRYMLTLSSESPKCAEKVLVQDLQIAIYLPVELPLVKTFRLYWNAKTQFSVAISRKNVTAKPWSQTRALEDTWAILEASFGSRFQIERMHLPVHFSPIGEIPLSRQLGRKPVLDTSQLENCPGLIRDNTKKAMPYQYIKWLEKKPVVEEVKLPYEGYDCVSAETPHLSLVHLPKRLDFLHRILLGNDTASTKAYSAVLPVPQCTVDEIPFRIVQFGRFIPSVLRRMEITFVADQLSKTLLRDVAISNLDLIVTAISASSAHEDSNYQRLEFLGDCVLKTCTSIQLFDEYPLWHEGYLSAKKDRLVSNSRLSKAAIQSGLDKFIITKAFTGHKWRPPYIENLLDAQSEIPKRNLSSKVLADVVEALIGASVIDGGLSKALKCLRVFLPELDWQPLDNRRHRLFQQVPDVDLPQTLNLLEDLIGYNFQKKALLIESMTHASSKTGSQSLERLEFLGDAILDNIVVTAMWEHGTELYNFQMHLLRTVLVNADFLAFICMEWATEQEKSDLIEVEATGEDGRTFKEFKGVSTTISVPLWRFMRHMSPTLGSVQRVTMGNHADLRDDLNDSIQRGTHYPWALLSKLQAPKFYSDIVESLIGAVWIDSGSMDVCRDLVERMGILPYLRRILRENVQVWHPKEEIGVLAESETVKYAVGTRRIGPAEVARMEYWCKVFVGDEEVVEVGGGVSKEEVQTKAAERAVQILKARKLQCTAEGEIAVVQVVQGGEDEMETEIDTAMAM